MKSHEEEVELLAPENFSMVENGCYRSAFPRTKNCGFVDRLGLKCVISLVPEDYPAAVQEFYVRAGIRLVPTGLDGNKYPFKEINMAQFHNTICFLLNPANRPCLIHCNKGKHRTGCVVACLRLLRGWALSAAYAEYLAFAGSKARLEDQVFIECYSRSHFVKDIPTSISSPYLTVSSPLPPLVSDVDPDPPVGAGVGAEIEAEALENESVVAEQIESERLLVEETERLEKDSLEVEQKETDRLERDRCSAERLEVECLKAELLEAKRIEAERVDRQRQIDFRPTLFQNAKIALTKQKGMFDFSSESDIRMNGLLALHSPESELIACGVTGEMLLDAGLQPEHLRTNQLNSLAKLAEEAKVARST